MCHVHAKCGGGLCPLWFKTDSVLNQYTISILDCLRNPIKNRFSWFAAARMPQI
jgi:hypothetical protein